MIFQPSIRIKNFRPWENFLMTSKLSKSDKSLSLAMVGFVQIREVAVALVIRVRITIRDQLPGFISDSLTAAAILLFFLMISHSHSLSRPSFSSKQLIRL